MEEHGEFPGESERGTDGDSHPKETRPGPTWRAWVVSILVAVALSVMATLLLSGPGAFHLERAAGAAGSGCGPGGNCCPPTGK